ncbi:P-loop containing nucleoside triphosphate hydrolase protein [Pyrenochaeta sp. MPI-SDFR-AT-0127]|nr:P-loop containing nucleoside triphosphate hydrolase protein [Pyrenochaeta sp. MPI-SDFR-AT-0127]
MPTVQTIGILIMGLTGAGKSTFISQLTRQDVEIGHSLESCTTDVMTYFFHRKNGQKIYLIDTPGFDDSHADDAKIFREIATFLCTICDGHSLKIGGLIYMQRITDMRMAGSSLKSLRIFEKICGEHCFQNVTVVTTMWSLLRTQAAHDGAIGREKTLWERPEFFGSLTQGGAKMERHEDTHESAVRIVEQLAERQGTITLRLQKEMTQSDNMTLGETSAGRFLEGELADARKRYEIEKKELEEFETGADEDDDLISVIVEQKNEVSKRIRQSELDQGSLSITREDMRRERTEWYMRTHDEDIDATAADGKSARVLELEEQLQRSATDMSRLQKDLQAQRRENLAQSEELEDRNKKYEALQKLRGEYEQLKRDRAAKDKAKRFRPFQNDFLQLVRGVLFASQNKESKELREPGQAPRRSDSIPHEMKQPKRYTSKPPRKGPRSKSRQGGKAGNRTHSTHDRQLDPPASSPRYTQDSHLPGQEYSNRTESEDDSEAEDLVPPIPEQVIMAPHGSTSSVASRYVLSTPYAQPPASGFSTNANLYTPMATVVMDPSGLLRNPPVPPSMSHTNLPGDIIIAVMGITGCGKTTFVNHFSENRLPIGHGLDSCTQSVEVVPCTLEDGTKIYLVDTPGFDDSLRTDSEILRKVALWLNKAHSSHLKLTGIIFLQRISDVRVGGSGIKNIKMFQKLCGDESLASVILATTMWDLAIEQAAVDREAQLKRDPMLWKRMIDHGSQVIRHDEQKASAEKIIKCLIASKRPVTLDIQREMVDQQLELLQTGAGSELASAVEKLIQHYEKKLKELENDLKEAWDKRDQERRDLLEAAREEHRANLAKNQEEMFKLRISAVELIEDAKKRYEETVAQAEENHQLQLGRQRILLQKQFKENYYKAMSEKACAIM